MKQINAKSDVSDADVVTHGLSGIALLPLALDQDPNLLGYFQHITMLHSFLSILIGCSKISTNKSALK